MTLRHGNSPRFLAPTTSIIVAHPPSKRSFNWLQPRREDFAPRGLVDFVLGGHEGRALTRKGSWPDAPVGLHPLAALAGHGGRARATKSSPFDLHSKLPAVWPDAPVGLSHLAALAGHGGRARATNRAWLHDPFSDSITRVFHPMHHGSSPPASVGLSFTGASLVGARLPLGE
jgi:hypothetical protein